MTAGKETGSQRAAKHDPKIAGAASKTKGGTVNVVLKEDHGSLKKGDSIGSVSLGEGVTLNYFVDAIRSGLASDEEALKETEEANKAAAEDEKKK